MQILRWAPETRVSVEVDGQHIDPPAEPPGWQDQTITQTAHHPAQKRRREAIVCYYRRRFDPYGRHGKKYHAK